MADSCPAQLLVSSDHKNDFTTKSKPDPTKTKFSPDSSQFIRAASDALCENYNTLLTSRQEGNEKFLNDS